MNAAILNGNRITKATPKLITVIPIKSNTKNNNFWNYYVFQNTKSIFKNKLIKIKNIFI